MQMDILAALNRRYATKKFLPEQKVSDHHLHELLEVVRLAPTAYGLQPFRVIVVSDAETKQQLRAFSGNQKQITEAPHLFVFAIVKDLGSHYFQEHLKIISEVRNIPMDALTECQKIFQANIQKNPHRTGIDGWSLSRAHLALGFLLLAAAEMDIDVCAIEDIDPKEYNKMLSLDGQGLSAAFVCAIGYRNPEDPNAHFVKIRRPFEQMVSYFTP